ncbi:ParA family protein [Saccharolobus caldissimus]|uniref:CobQ/CobB/MinD/ParA nucleotide binding domain-containing protein n=1 Tax=Saccharolobus caldissimus TaxID=1702097 RepID=A0AAQ4CT13_9CREN|nr:ParA family protein [Saccharolobus caldissimus]BDB98944.1 hypothetical protein SACC_19610 [Saccharolobus caldissimus]
MLLESKKNFTEKYLLKGVVRVLGIKGGVGKSAIAYSLAKIISLSSKVLFLDMDNLFTISKLFNVKECELSRVGNITMYACKDISKVPFDDYEYIIIDTYPAILEGELPNINSSKVHNIFVTDYFSIEDTLEYAKRWKGNNILIINMTNPDHEIERIQFKVASSLALKKDVTLRRIIIIPFEDEYYGSYRVDLPKIETVLGYIMT